MNENHNYNQFPRTRHEKTYLKVAIFCNMIWFVIVIPITWKPTTFANYFALNACFHHEAPRHLDWRTSLPFTYVVMYYDI